MNKVLIDTFYHKVMDGTPLEKIPKPYQAEVQKLIDGVEEEPKKSIEISLAGVANTQTTQKQEL